MVELRLSEDDFPEEVEIERPLSRSAGLEGWRSELSSYYSEMRKFEAMDPVEVFLRLSAYSARAAEIRSQAIRNDSRAYLKFRTQEIDPFIEQCEFQFRVHSRIQAVRDMEVRLSGGAT